MTFSAVQRKFELTVFVFFVKGYWAVLTLTTVLKVPILETSKTTTAPMLKTNKRPVNKQTKRKVSQFKIFSFHVFILLELTMSLAFHLRLLIAYVVQRVIRQLLGTFATVVSALLKIIIFCAYFEDGLSQFTGISKWDSKLRAIKQI